MNWKTVVKINFTDGTSAVRNFSDEDLYSLDFFNNDRLTNYFEFKFDCGTVVDFSFEKTGHMFDVRDYFNEYVEPHGVEFDGKVIDNIEFLPENSYEYNLAALEMDRPGNLYLRYVSLDIEEADYDYYKDLYEHGADAYSDDPY
jgi:hypothetical protein